ncbi:MAG: FMN-binding protein [Christensenellales bacterium]
MKYKRYGKGVLIAAVAAALILALAGCNDGNVAPSPTGTNGGPNPSTAPIGSPGMDDVEDILDEDDAPQTTTVPFNPDAPTSFKAGTYTGKGKGMNGDVTVKVVFSDSAIVSVDVVDHKETEGIYEKAAEDIPRAIVGGQTLSVDTVSGATYTSEAIIQAVTDCVVQAGGDVAALGGKTNGNNANNGGAGNNNAGISPSPSP